MSILQLEVKVETSEGQIVSVSLAPSAKFSLRIQGNPPLVLDNKIEEWFATYRAGKRPLIALPLNLADFPPFTRAVLEALKQIPWGKTLTYREIAALAGSPGAQRAAGAACRRNPFPLFIPCHRIVLADGTLGGYRFGSSLKKQLLSFENSY